MIWIDGEWLWNGLELVLIVNSYNWERESYWFYYLDFKYHYLVLWLFYSVSFSLSFHTQTTTTHIYKERLSSVLFLSSWCFLPIFPPHLISKWLRLCRVDFFIVACGIENSFYGFYSCSSYTVFNILYIFCNIRSGSNNKRKWKRWIFFLFSFGILNLLNVIWYRS